jgi:hypothetical protein
MFPFQSSRTYTFDIPNNLMYDQQKLINCFVSQLDVTDINQNVIRFKNFKSFPRRHNWFSEGKIVCEVEGTQLLVSLELNYYHTPTLIAFFSIWFFIFHIEQIWLAISIISVLWIVYSGLYLWSCSMFRRVIRSCVRKNLGVQSIM